MFLRVAVPIVLSLLVGACSAAPVLRVGTSGDYPPFSVVANGSTPTGFEIAVAEQFARDTGHSLNLVPFRWPQLLDDLESNRFAVAMSGVTVRPDRALRVRFSRPYAITGAVVVRRAEDDRFATLADVDRAGVRIAVNRGGHLERVTRARFSRAEILPIEDNSRLLEVLESRQADVVVSEAFEAATWPRDRVFALSPFTRDRKAYAVAPAQTDLLARLDDWLAARERDGWLDRQRRRWLGAGASWTPADACFEAIAMAIDVRLQLMPAVAHAKRVAALPIEDREQEAKVLAAVQAKANSLELDPDAARRLYGALIEAAKAVQRDISAERATGPDAVELAELRAAIGFESDRLLREVARCRAMLAADPGADDSLEKRLRDGIALHEAARIDTSALAAGIRKLLRR